MSSNKAALVIDMPKSCEECRLKYLDTGDDAYFGMNVYRCVLDGAEINRNERWDDCPLRPLPQKKTYEEPTCLEDYKVSQMLVMANADGWNACLDEILGETE